MFHNLKVHSSHKVASHFGLKLHFCTKCGYYGPPGGKSPGLKLPCRSPTRHGQQALRKILRGVWPTHEAKRRRRDFQPVRLGRFARQALSKRHTLRHAGANYGKSNRVISKVRPRPREVRPPGPPIPSDPGACPKHLGGKGWTMLDPCEDCIALAMGTAPAYESLPGDKQVSLLSASSSSDSHNGNRSPPGAEEEEGVSLPAPPPPPPVTCPRHRRGRGWSLLSPCEECISLAWESELV